MRTKITLTAMTAFLLACLGPVGDTATSSDDDLIEACVWGVVDASTDMGCPGDTAWVDEGIETCTREVEQGTFDGLTPQEVYDLMYISAVDVGCE